MPLECQPPVKAAHHRLICLHVELKCVPVNGVNNRTYDGGLILSNSDDRKDDIKFAFPWLIHFTNLLLWIIEVFLYYI